MIPDSVLGRSLAHVWCTSVAMKTKMRKLNTEEKEGGVLGEVRWGLMYFFTLTPPATKDPELIRRLWSPSASNAPQVLAH